MSETEQINDVHRTQGLPIDGDNDQSREVQTDDDDSEASERDIQQQLSSTPAKRPNPKRVEFAGVQKRGSRNSF